MSETFGIGVGEIFSRGLAAYGRGFAPVSVAGAATLAVLVGVGTPAQILWNDDQTIQAYVLGLVALVATGTVAAVWYRAALAVADDVGFEVGDVFGGGVPWVGQLVASCWFWAGVFVGPQLGGPLFGTLIALLVLVFYLFHGFVLADGRTDSGLKALGESVRMSDKRRIAVFALIAMFFMLNFVALLPLSFGLESGLSLDPIRVAITLALLLVTTSYTMVCGAVLYRSLIDLGVLDGPMTVGRARSGKRSNGTKRSKGTKR